MIAAVAVLTGIPGAMAATTDYSVPGGQTLTYFISGGDPWLSNMVGSAQIVTYNSNSVDVRCLETFPTICTGTLNR